MLGFPRPNARPSAARTRFEVAVGQFFALLLAGVVAALLQVPLAADSVAEATPPPPPSELIQKRTASSRTLDNHDGTFTTSLYSGPVHFRDGQGSWQPISSALVPSLESGYAYQNEANRFRAAFKSQLGANFLSLTTGGDSYRLGLDQAVSTGAQTRVRGLTYPQVFPGVDLRYDLQPDGVKETLVLASAQVPLSYRFRLTPPAGSHVHAARNPDGSWSFFAAPHARPVFVLEAPWAAEDGELRAAAGHATLAVTRSGADFLLDLSLDSAWLQNPLRRFPVRVDPTITVQPAFQDASFNNNCPQCTGLTGERLSIGTEGIAGTWRSGLQFSLADIPAGASISDAKLKLYFDGTCLTGTGNCGGTAHQIDAMRMTSSWSSKSASSELTFATPALASYTLAQNPSARWMEWSLTSTVQSWVSGTQSNFGLLLKRATEPPSVSGPKPPSRNYAAEPTLGPKLEVTYNGNGGELLEPETVHANGAELQWIPYGGPGAPPFDSYEVHRSASVSFTPSAATMLTKIIGDPSATTYRDTTAKPGATFTYKIVFNGAETNARTVTMPADGQARKLLRPDALAGLETYVAQRSDSLECINRGASERLRVGTDAISIWRSLLRFKLADIPPDATISDATLSLWHPETTSTALTLRAHRLTGNWQEGTGIDTCSADGATWYETDGGVRWVQDGGDFNATVAASLAIPAGAQPAWSQWSLTSLVQQWVAGTYPNHGLMLKLDDETRVAGKSVDFYAGDFAVAPTLRPKLAITYMDGSHATSPTVAIAKPTAGSFVNGTATIEAAAWDDRRVESVQFFVDGNSIGTDTSEPFSSSWNSTNGSHSLTARATDDAGNQTTSTAVPVTADNSPPPTTSITSPTGGQVVGTVTVKANASLSATKVEFYADNLRVATDTTAPYEASWNTLDPALPAYDGSHTLKTKAYDGIGQVTTSASVSVTAANATQTKYLATFSSSPYPVSVIDLPTQVYPINVTITNSSGVTWSGTDIVLRFRWYATGDFTAPVDSANISLPGPVLPGGQVTVSAPVTPPGMATGIARGTYRLRFDLFEVTTGSWFASKGNKPLEGSVQVEPNPPGTGLSVPEKLGLEPYFRYQREDLGGGMSNFVNVATGNSVIRWTPFQAPGIGLPSVVQLTFNSTEGHCPAEECPAGAGWSLAISSLIRFGHNQLYENGSKLKFNDADGTLHIFDCDQSWHCTPPDGTHLYARKDLQSTDRRWLITSPDRVTHYFDDHGYPTFVSDKNGNELQFDLEDDPPGNKRVHRVIDEGGRAFTLSYYLADEGNNKRLKQIVDHSGHALTFFYDQDDLTRVEEQGGLNADGTTLPPRSIEFEYGHGKEHDRLLTVRDPRGAADHGLTPTTFSYYTNHPDDEKLWTRINRAGKPTTFAYPTASTTTVAAPLNRNWTYTHNDGLVSQFVDPLNRTTLLGWTARQLHTITDQPTGRFVEFLYNGNGRLTDAYDQLRNRTQLTYFNEPADGGDTALSISLLKTYADPEGHIWSFFYDAGKINLLSVFDPIYSDRPYRSFDYYKGPPTDTEPKGALKEVKDGNLNATAFSPLPTGHRRQGPGRPVLLRRERPAARDPGSTPLRRPGNHPAPLPDRPRLRQLPSARPRQRTEVDPHQPRHAHLAEGRLRRKRQRPHLPPAGLRRPRGRCYDNDGLQPDGPAAHGHKSRGAQDGLHLRRREPSCDDAAAEGIHHPAAAGARLRDRLCLRRPRPRRQRDQVRRGWRSLPPHALLLRRRRRSPLGDRAKRRLADGPHGLPSGNVAQLPGRLSARLYEALLLRRGTSAEGNYRGSRRKLRR